LRLVVLNFRLKPIWGILRIEHRSEVSIELKPGETQPSVSRSNTGNEIRLEADNRIPAKGLFKAEWFKRLSVAAQLVGDRCAL